MQCASLTAVVSFAQTIWWRHAPPLCLINAVPAQGLESCLKGPDNYNSQVLIEATVIALTKLQPLLDQVQSRCLRDSIIKTSAVMSVYNRPYDITRL